METLRPTVTSAQAAKTLGKHVNTINRMAGDGRLNPVAKAPGRRGAYLFDPAEVERVRRELAGDTDSVPLPRTG